MAGAAQHEGEGGGERDQGGEQAAADTRGGVADGGHGLYDRAGGYLAERDAVEELAAGHPVMAHRVGLHERDDHEPAPERQSADLERGPGDRYEYAAGGGRA